MGIKEAYKKIKNLKKENFKYYEVYQSAGYWSYDDACTSILKIIEEECPEVKEQDE